MTEYYQLMFSAENNEQAEAIVKTLTHKRLIVGGTVFHGPSHFWWKGNEIDMDYYYVFAFTVGENRKKIEEEYGIVSKEEMPMVSFVKMDGNEQFLVYIFENTKQ